MDGILAVVAPTEADVHLLEEAGTVAAATGVDVVVLALAQEDTEHASVEAMRQWEGFEGADLGDSTETPRHFAEYLGDVVLAPRGVTYTAVGERVENMRPSEKTIDVAKNHGCDHVYVLNRSQSPAGKALFGDTTQSVILNFDGFVTVRTA
jgi:nucleotide-binding universal stress UspA family protein